MAKEIANTKQANTSVFIAKMRCFGIPIKKWLTRHYG